MNNVHSFVFHDNRLYIYVWADGIRKCRSVFALSPLFHEAQDVIVSSLFTSQVSTWGTLLPGPVDLT